MEYENTSNHNQQEAGRYLRKADVKKRYRRRKRQRQLLLITAIALLILTAIFVLRVCFNSDKLEGTWRYDDVTAYQFDGKGNGKLILPEKEYPFSYEVAKDTLSIDFENEAARDAAYVYSTNGNQLTLISGEGEDSIIYVLTK